MSVAIELAKSGEALKSGPWGLAIILILCVACYFLFKSMSKHLKTVREDFPLGAAKESEPVAPAAEVQIVEASDGPAEQPLV